MKETQPGLGNKWLPSRPLLECAESQEKFVTLSEPVSYSFSPTTCFRVGGPWAPPAQGRREKVEAPQEETGFRTGTWTPHRHGGMRVVHTCV